MQTFLVCLWSRLFGDLHCLGVDYFHSNAAIETGLVIGASQSRLPIISSTVSASTVTFYILVGFAALQTLVDLLLGIRVGIILAYPYYRDNGERYDGFWCPASWKVRTQCRWFATGGLFVYSQLQQYVFHVGLCAYYGNCIPHPAWWTFLVVPQPVLFIFSWIFTYFFCKNLYKKLQQ